jgi:hypothetical protein
LQFHENPPGLYYVGHQQPELAECPGVNQVKRPEVYSRITQSGRNLVKAAWRILNRQDKLLELHIILSFPGTSGEEFAPQFLMSLRDTPNHEKTRKIGGAKRDPSGLFVAEICGAILSLRGWSPPFLSPQSWHSARLRAR